MGKWLICAALALGAPARGQTARELNAEGFKLYRRGKFPEALGTFQRAFQKDQTLAIAHYNYAATLGVLRKAGHVCELDAYRPVILDHLERAIALDPRRRARMRQDPDLDPIRDTVRYQQLLGRSLARPQDARAFIESVSWFGPGQGAFGSMIGLTFKPGGEGVLWRREMTNEDAAPRTVSYPGRARFEGARVTLTLSTPLDGRAEFEGRLTPSGSLEFPEPLGLLTDQLSECDA